ncbi:MAG: 23S rRNA (pseudouridine(1915)-N(3))-methyltransferase RlmH, partial [Deltaproteobacteria bacterium]|nr:23S rRNA (pseudouridine(1915)-N(3))-methyltransferase RlmH [Deltaproteobacteria bacterium]
MNISLICVGRLKDKAFKDSFNEYFSRLKRYTSVEHIEVKDEHQGKGRELSAKKEAVRKEADSISKKLKQGDFIVVLSEEGTGYTSNNFASFIEGIASRGVNRAVFIVGGPHGVGPALTTRADKVLSLSLMTMPHELARVVLVEQMYR